MTRPRSQIVSLADTLFYHCVSRCVRRAFLCGDDRYSGKNFDHRKPGLVDRLTLLGEVFAIDIATYAVMSNHYHLVLHIDESRARTWDRGEVIHRWLSLYKGDPLVHGYLRGELRSEAEYRQLDRIIKTWRERLTSISWFMRCLNEYIARRANRGDNCTGRFWEGRFKSQALLDEAASLPFDLRSYIELVSWAGRIARTDKKGFIPADAPPILSDLLLNGPQWRMLSLEIQKEAITMFNGLDKLAARERNLARKAA